jgi:hypothetical protein
MLGVVGLVGASVSAAAGLFGLAIGLGVLAGTGIGALLRSRQIRHLVGLYGWQTHPVRPPQHAMDRSIVVTDGHPDDGVYQLSATRSRMQRFAAGHHQAVLIAGHPGRSVVIAPPDGSMILFASRPRVAALRRAYLDAPHAPLTPQAQAKFHREAVIVLFSIAFGTMALAYAFLLMGWPTGLAMTGMAGAGLALTVRRWRDLPRQRPSS